MAKRSTLIRNAEDYPRILLGDRPPSYLSKARLATELDISESTVDDYVKRGLLPRPVRLGGSVRWSWIQVETALESVSFDRSLDDPFLVGLKNVS